MKPSLSSLKRIALVLGVLAVAALLLLWQALPRLLQWQAEKFVAEKTGHRLVMELPEFNPFELALRLGRLQLDDPAGQPLLAFDGLLVDLSGASLTQRAWVFDAIRIDGLAATLVELPEGRLNWTPFLDALKSKEETPEEKKGLPRLMIRSFVLANGRIDYADRRRTAEGFGTRIEPLDLELKELSTLPDQEGQYRLTALTALGARIELAGKIDLDPLRVAGAVSLADLQLAKLAPYLQAVLPVPPEGMLELSADIQAGNDGSRFDATVDHLQAKLTGLTVALKEAAGPVARIEAIELKDGRFRLADQQLAIAAVTVGNGQLAFPGIEPPPRFAALNVEDVQVALAERKASVGGVRLDGGRVELRRDGAGRIELVEALKALGGGKQPEGKAEAPTGEAAPPWRYQVGKIEVADFGLRLVDASVQPAFEFALEHVMAETSGLSEDMSASLPVKLAFDVASGGRFEAQGKVVPATAAAEVEFRLTDLALEPAQPFLAAKTTLTLAAGRLSTRGRAVFDDKGPHVKGEFALRDLRLVEPGSSKPLLAWRSLATRRFSFAPDRLDLGELTLAGLDTRLLIDKEKNLNLRRVLKAQGEEKPAAPEGKPGAVSSAPTFVVNIDRLRFIKGEMDFADESLVLPFATRIHDLQGSIAGLSNRPGAVGQIELEGAVDEYGMARAAGQVELANPTNGLDMRVQFRNIEMTRLTPYMATFAGRKIDSGKLSLDLEYKIEQRQLAGDNQVIMDQLTLGERVESPTAKDLPLDLAIALLQDADGRIDLGLPVSGSLDDPQFSYGSLIWKAITNVITKIVTAPFRALGALFGSGEQLEEIAFEPGAMQLTPPEREKAMKLATALGKRPKLALTLTGLYADDDRVALQDRRLRRTVLARAGQSVPEAGDPGPISTQQPKIREALEALYKERFGSAELAALKEGFRKANPGQLEEGVAGKLVSRLTGLLREKKTLSEDEISRLKGADFYAVLYDRLREREEIPDARLQELAQQRSETLRALLESAGVEARRLRAAPVEKSKAEEVTPRGIALRMALETMKANN
ncbi:MAG: DUF748 domain-containing protein [Rhodocyclaceae bacterium]